MVAYLEPTYMMASSFPDQLPHERRRSLQARGQEVSTLRVRRRGRQHEGAAETLDKEY